MYPTLYKIVEMIGRESYGVKMKLKAPNRCVWPVNSCQLETLAASIPEPSLEELVLGDDKDSIYQEKNTTPNPSNSSSTMCSMVNSTQTFSATDFWRRYER